MEGGGTNEAGHYEAKAEGFKLAARLLFNTSKIFYHK